MKPASTAQRKLAIALELHEAGIALMRHRLSPGSRTAAGTTATSFRRWLSRIDDPIPGDVAGPVRLRYRAP